MKTSFKMNLAALAVCISAISAVHATESDNLQPLIAKAKKEAPITIYASTGKIVAQAKAFTEKYGVNAVGVKAKAPQIIEIISCEAQANNVRADVAFIEDTPAAIKQLLAKGYVISWLPEQLKTDIPLRFQYPLVVALAPNLLAYNTSLHDSCPITNMWQLTESKWRGKVALQEPTGKPAYTDWFSQMANNHDQQVRDAYLQQFGKPLETEESSAMAAFVKALASNRPLLTKSDTEAAEAVGSPDGKSDFVGVVSTAKFRKNKDGMKLGICNGMKPFIGWSYPSLGFITAGTQSPNAAKLFMHYFMTSEGFAPQGVDGKMSTNQTVVLPVNEPSGIAKYRDQLMEFNSQTAEKDWQERQYWQDLWILNYRK